MRLIRIKATEHTQRSFRERQEVKISEATLWPVNDEEQVHDARARSGRLDAESVPLEPQKNWIRRLMEGVKRAWERS